MDVQVENGMLVIRMPLQTAAPSKSGKTLVVASSGGFRATGATVDGRAVSVNVTATVKA